MCRWDPYHPTGQIFPRGSFSLSFLGFRNQSRSETSARKIRTPKKIALVFRALYGLVPIGSDGTEGSGSIPLHPAPPAPSDHGSYKTALPATSKDEFILCDILLFGYLDSANKIPSPCKNAQ